MVVLPTRAPIFFGSVWAELLLQLYFVFPALFAVLGSLAIRRIVAQLCPELLLTLGAIGFAVFGLLDGLNHISVYLAFTMRAGIGVSSALLMTGFNRIATLSYHISTSNWLLAYLNLATSAYGLAITLIATRLADISPTVPFLLFCLPALGLPFFFAARRGTAVRQPILNVSSCKDHPSVVPPLLLLDIIVVSHMAIHVLFYFHLAQRELTIADETLSNGEATAIYVLGHVFGAIFFKPLNRHVTDATAHLTLALAASFASTMGLALSENGILGTIFLLFGGLSLSHVLPLVFTSI
ncbi:MAG: hypothetical protein ACR2RE_05035, partial [Geminicoccaceae bacterium]